MKFVVILGDGMADHPVEDLGWRTPLQVAYKPNMDLVARFGRSGLAKTIPNGMAPGSDVANLSVMGYDPKRYYTGRAPLEAAAMGISLKEEEIAFRCNFVTVNDGVMDDYSAGHITSSDGRELVEALRPLVPGWRLYPGVGYRNLLVLDAGEGAVCTPPHDITGQPIEEHLPRGEGSELLKGLMEASRPILASHKVNLRRVAEGRRPANMIWLWGQGRAPGIPRFVEKHGLRGAVISAVDLLKGIGICAGLEVIEVQGATGTLETNYHGKVDAALKALERVDLVYLHIEAPDEAAHEGDVDLKVKAIELLDLKAVGPVIQGLEAWGRDWRVLLLPDHATPISIRTHTCEPVPFAITGRGIEPDGVQTFDEFASKEGGYGLVEGTELIRMLVGGEANAQHLSGCRW
jgi:2,3-bisphosphoglycerate-independent phosphoglycerate mutase